MKGTDPSVKALLISDNFGFGFFPSVDDLVVSKGKVGKISSEDPYYVRPLGSFIAFKAEEHEVYPVPDYLLSRL